jgi:hypothetical protein
MGRKEIIIKIARERANTNKTPPDSIAQVLDLKGKTILCVGSTVAFVDCTNGYNKSNVDNVSHIEPQ